MSVVFADTSFYIALSSERDHLHHKAVSFLANSEDNILTTRFILLEVANFLRRSSARDVYLQLIKLINSDERSTILPLSNLLFDRGEKLFASRSDKDWSLTDCISFVVMQEQGITAALTGDHHFEQAGFTALLK